MLARENPFRSERLHSLRYRPVPEHANVDGSGPDALARLVLARRRGAIVGPHGSGKTTLLIELAASLAQAGRHVRSIHLVRDAGRVCGPWRELLASPPGAGEVVLLDGGGDLAWPAFARVAFACRRADAFVITNHAPGRLRTLLRTATSPALLDALLDELLGGAAEPHRAHARAAFVAHRGDLRAVFRELYDRC